MDVEVLAFEIHVVTIVDEVVVGDVFTDFTSSSESVGDARHLLCGIIPTATHFLSRHAQQRKRDSAFSIKICNNAADFLTNKTSSIIPARINALQRDRTTEK